MRAKDNLKFMYYHVTTDINSESIRDSGLDPSRATGKMKAVWVVTEERLLWAIIHVSARHHVSTDNLIVCEVPNASGSAPLRRFSLPGVFTCLSVLPTGYHYPALEFIEKLG